MNHTCHFSTNPSIAHHNTKFVLVSLVQLEKVVNNMNLSSNSTFTKY